MDKDKKEEFLALQDSFYSSHKKLYEMPLYLIGFTTYIDKSTNFPSTHSLSTNDLNILLDLISLVKEPIDYHNLGNSFNNEEIFSYCSKYAFPLCDNDNSVHEHGEGLNKIVYSRILLMHFRKKVTDLYLLFNLWKSITEDNEVNSKKYSLLLDVNLQNVNVISYPDLLAFYLDKKMTSIHMKFSKLIVNELYLDTDNLLSMCYFQLANLATKPNEELDKHFKICIGCKKLIWVAHANTRHCKNCNRKTIFSRKKRKAKKNMEV